MIELENGYFAHIQHVRIADSTTAEDFVTVINEFPEEISWRMIKLSSHLTLARIYPTIESRSDGDNPISFGVSGCSKMDNFSKKLGRTISIGRALKKLNN